ncbi:MAG TPA: hypothetical protein VFQ53_29550 [Kofleriaceae bacterium]|nr:hypothetical protein [Kofleriaceae bacterium]
MSYVVADEPIETSWRNYVCHPGAPLLAEMLCGSWLALPWFAFNAIAMGSPTRKKELALCVAGFVVTGVLAAIVIALRDADIIESSTVMRLCILGIVTWKLAIAYIIQTIQARTFHVYEYYGGTVRTGNAIIATGFLLRDYVLALSDDPRWIIIVMGLG